jgi:hypothetical protein
MYDVGYFTISGMDWQEILYSHSLCCLDIFCYLIWWSSPKDRSSPMPIPNAGVQPYQTQSLTTMGLNFRLDHEEQEFELRVWQACFQHPCMDPSQRPSTSGDLVLLLCCHLGICPPFILKCRIPTWMCQQELETYCNVPKFEVPLGGTIFPCTCQQWTAYPKTYMGALLENDRFLLCTLSKRKCTGDFGRFVFKSLQHLVKVIRAEFVEEPFAVTS